MSNNRTFEEIKELVAKKYEPLSKIDWEWLSEKGQFMYDVYDELDDCFCFSDNLAEYVLNVAKSIQDLLKPEWYWSPENIEHKKKVAERLRRFVRFQIAKELWENIPEFANRKEN